MGRGWVHWGAVGSGTAVKAGMSRRGMVHCGLVRRGGQGMMWYGEVTTGTGKARLGMAVAVGLDPAASGKAGKAVVVRTGEARSV